MAYLNESFLAATRLALGLPSTAVPRGAAAPQRPGAEATERVHPWRYPALTPPRSSAPGPSARPGLGSLRSSQSCR
jgi:hypothetical protein